MAEGEVYHAVQNEEGEHEVEEAGSLWGQAHGIVHDAGPVHTATLPPHF